MLSDDEVQGLLRALGNEVHPCPQTVRDYLMDLIQGGCPGENEGVIPLDQEPQGQ